MHDQANLRLSGVELPHCLWTGKSLCSWHSSTGISAFGTGLQSTKPVLDLEEVKTSPLVNHSYPYPLLRQKSQPTLGFSKNTFNSLSTRLGWHSPRFISPMIDFCLSRCLSISRSKRDCVSIVASWASGMAQSQPHSVAIFSRNKQQYCTRRQFPIDFKEYRWPSW